MKKINLKIQTIEPELFSPEQLELSIIENYGDTTKIFVELTQYYPEPNYGICKRSRSFIVPTALIDSLQLSWKGEILNQQALAGVLQAFNLSLVNN